MLNRQERDALARIVATLARFRPARRPDVLNAALRRSSIAPYAAIVDAPTERVSTRIRRLTRNPTTRDD